MCLCSYILHSFQQEYHLIQRAIEYTIQCTTSSTYPVRLPSHPITHPSSYTNQQNQTGLCKRRHWPDPLYSSYKTTTTTPTQSPTTTTNTTSINTPGTTTTTTTTTGYTCTVRVNNREYQTDSVWESEPLARENAAMRAYLICRNFSVNDGMYPAGTDHGGVVQGVPVAIGTGRKGVGVYSQFQYGNGFGGAGRVGSDSGSASGSGGGSP